MFEHLPTRFLLLACVAVGCSAGGSPSLDVGTEGAGGRAGSLPETGGSAVGLFPDSGASNALSAHIESPPGVTVEFVKLSCSNACADVMAVVHGGFEPYSLSWEDGSTERTRRVCPSASTAYELTATDSGNTRGEFPRAPDTVHARLTATVIGCGAGESDAGRGSDAGPSPSPDPSAPLAVAGQADIWLAGQAAGTELPCHCADDPNGKDVAFADSPVPLPVTAGTTLTFSVSGTTALGLCSGPTPDGGCFVPTPPLTMGPANGISTLVAPYNALVGVFLDDTVPPGAEPAALDASAITAPIVSPLLRQVFFIGDGVTGTGSGTVQQFVVPPGATRLFLGSSDSTGGNYNNSGTFTVVVTPL